MWATRPHLGSIFEKLLHRKTFYSPAACPRKTSRIRFGKAGAYPQLALGIAQLPLKPYLSLQPPDSNGNCDSFDSLFDFCFSSLCSFICFANVGFAHTSAAFLKNCCTEKLFIRLRLVLGKPPESGSARLGHIPSLPWESQLPLKPYLSLQPFDFEGNCDSFDSLFDFCFSSLCSFICSANVGCSPTPRQHF